MWKTVQRTFSMTMDTTVTPSTFVPILYAHPHSPGSRAVFITAKYLNINLDIKDILTAKKEHLTEEFLKLNPQHTIPTLNHNGHILCDSHAIATFLCNKYQPNHHLYPEHPVCRSLIDQRLYFDASILFPLYKKCIRKIKYSGAFEQTEEDLAAHTESCEFLEAFLRGNDYLTGKHLSLADFFCGATITQTDKIMPIDYVRFGSIKAWLDRLKDLEHFQAVNTETVDSFAIIIQQVIEENRKMATKN